MSLATSLGVAISCLSQQVPVSDLAVALTRCDCSSPGFHAYKSARDDCSSPLPVHQNCGNRRIATGCNLCANMSALLRLPLNRIPRLPADMDRSDLVLHCKT